MKALFLSTARRWRSTASRANTISRNLRKQAAANASTFAVAFDIDGVLYRGSQDITPAKATILDLQKRNIPILFLTNGGGLTEARKVHLLGERLGIPTLTADQMFQSHTPMKHLNEFKHKLILAVGKNNTKQILENYGYTNIMTVDEYHEQFPASFPDIAPKKIHGKRIQKYHDEPIHAVMALMDPHLWFRDLQICCDVLRSNGKVGNLDGQEKQIVPLFMSCPDFEYVTEFSIPRFGSGTFGIVLQHLYKKLTSNELNVQWYGKPMISTYKYAEIQINNIASELGYDRVHRVYAIGDNPESDIQGANNAGKQWTSILVKTGMFTDDGNHSAHPADVVVNDVGNALNWILEQENNTPKRLP